VVLLKATPASYKTPSPPINGTAKGTRTNWNTEENFPILHEAVMAFLNHSDNADPLTVAMVPQQTLRDHAKHFRSHAMVLGLSFIELTCKDVYKSSTHWRCLLDTKQLKLLNEMIVLRDQRNNGMSRHKVILLIMELLQSSSFKKCKNHFDYLIRSKQIKGVK
jgi:hypothetical protein